MKSDLTPETIKKYIESLKILENSQKKGLINGKWYPYGSLEGGNDTTAYGHKITGKEGIDFYKGITESQATQLLEKDIIEHQKLAKEQIDGKYGAGKFDSLPQDHQMLLTDYVFNGVQLSGFPLFTKGVLENNKETMLNEYERYYKDKNGVTKPLIERNKWTKSVIDVIPDKLDNKSSEYKLPYNILPNYIYSLPLDNLKVNKQNQYLFKSGGMFKNPPPGDPTKPTIYRPPGDPSIQAYTDSLNNYNWTRQMVNAINSNNPGIVPVSAPNQVNNQRFLGFGNQIPNNVLNFQNSIWYGSNGNLNLYNNNYVPVYEKPVQPVESNLPISPLPTKTINQITSPKPTPPLPSLKPRPIPSPTKPNKNLYIQFKDPKQSTRTSQEMIRFGDWDTYKEFNDALRSAGKMFGSSSMNMAKTQASSSYGGLTKEEAMEIYKKYTTPKLGYKAGGLFKDPPVNPIPSPIPSGVNVFATSNSIYKTPNSTTANKPVEYNPVYKSLAEKNFTKEELSAINNKKPDVLRQDRSAPKPVKLTPFEQKVLEKEIEAQTLGQQKVTYNQFGEPVLQWDPTQPKASGRVEPDYMDPITMAATFGAGAYGLGYNIPSAIGIGLDNALFNLPSLSRSGLNLGYNAIKNTVDQSIKSGVLPKFKYYKPAGVSTQGYANNQKIGFPLPNYIDDGLKESNNTIITKGQQILNELSSSEGTRRLRNQFKLADPNLTEEQLDHLVTTRLKEMHDAIYFNQAGFMLNHGKNVTNYSVEEMLNHFYPYRNAHWSSFNPHPNIVKIDAPTHLFPTAQSQTQSGLRFNLKKRSGYDLFTDPNYSPSSVALGKDLEKNIMVLDHEIGGHGIQKGGEIPIDADLKKLLPRNTSYRKDPSTGTVTITDNRPWLEKKLNPLKPEDFRAKEYFDFADNRTYNNERFPFLVEQRRKMIERGILKDRYDKVTPWKLFQAWKASNKNIRENFEEGDRLIKFTPFWKYGKLSKIMNEAPVLVPGIGLGGIGIGGAGALQGKEETPQYKKGGIFKNKNNIDNTSSNKRDFSNKFNSKLNDIYQKGFDYHSKQFPGLINDVYDYDTKGFYKSVYDLNNGDYNAITKALTPGSPTEHIGTDKFKKPNHPTFSNQSIYSIPIIRPGGKWGHNEEGDYFKATKRNIKNMINSDGSPLNYFKRAEDYNQDGTPDVNLIYKGKKAFAKGGLNKKKKRTNNITNPLYKSNEDYVYNAWRNSLPENLREESESYNLRGAWKAGLEPEYVTDDMAFHLASRDPYTGEILKAPSHDTYDMAIEGDIRAGYGPRIDARTGKVYTINNSIDPVIEGPFKKAFAKGGVFKIKNK